MALTDPSIILGINPPQQPNNLLSMYSQVQALKAQQGELAQQQKAAQTQNQLRAIFTDPENIDPDTGLPKAAAIGQVMKLDPNVGLKLFEGVAQAKNTEAESQIHHADIVSKKNDMADTARSAALESYDTDLANGVPVEQAKKNAQTVYGDGVDTLKKSGLFSKVEADAMPSDFDPVRMRVNSEKYQAWKEQQKKDKLAADKEADAVKRADRSETEREHHDSVMEALANRKENIVINNAKGGGGPTLDADGIDYVAQKYRETGVMPPLGMGKAAAGMRSAIIQRAAEMAKADGKGAAGDVATAADTKATTAGMANLGKMRASVEQAEGNASKEADLVLSLVDKGGLPGGPSALGKWVQGARTGVFNDPDASKFQTAVESLKNEYVKVLSTQGGMSGGQSSDAARREADQYINPRLSKAQIKGNIEIMRQSMKNRTNAIAEAYKTEHDRLNPGAGGGTKKLHYDAQGNLVQ